MRTFIHPSPQTSIGLYVSALFFPIFPFSSIFSGLKLWKSILINFLSHFNHPRRSGHASKRYSHLLRFCFLILAPKWEGDKNLLMQIVLLLDFLPYFHPIDQKKVELRTQYMIVCTLSNIVIKKKYVHFYLLCISKSGMNIDIRKMLTHGKFDYDH